MIPARHFTEYQQSCYNPKDMTVQVEFIKSIPYFSGLRQAELDSIRRFILEKKADRGEILLFEGEPAETLYFVVAGVVKVFNQ